MVYRGLSQFPRASKPPFLHPERGGASLWRLGNFCSKSRCGEALSSKAPSAPAVIPSDSGAQLEEAKDTYDDAVRQVDVEVQQALDQVAESQETIESQEKAIQEAEESLRLAQERLRAGAGTQLDVLSAQVALTQSRTTLVQAQYNYNIAMAQFDRVTAANTRWQDLFHDPLVDHQRKQEGLPVATADMTSAPAEGGK